MKIFKILSIILIGIALVSCGGSKKFKKNPIDDIIKELPTDKPYSIILNDMDVHGSFFEHYFHQYKIIKSDSAVQMGDSIVYLPTVTTTDFMEVSESYFKLHADDMGMEIAARDENGKLSKSTNPPGYSSYVGNPRYGRWEQRGGNSFWAFYGQYAFMSSMFNMMAYPVRRSYYNDWRGNYYGTGRTYYGPTSGTSGRYYGTGSTYTRSTRPNSTWSRNNSRFKDKVRSRTSRSGSRYSGSSSRSRGGGYGK
ncbi:MAG: hypothetical protein AAFQ94_25420 [Bacteroidota bacterium]